MKKINKKKFSKKKKKKKNICECIKWKVKDFRKKDTVEYYNKKEKKERYDWIDVAKAIAMIFIFLGHWQSTRIGNFAYSFHLQLFFMASGFFALHMQKDTFMEMLKKLFKRIILPLFCWAVISYVIINLDSYDAIKNLPDLFLKTGEVQPNYWFLPALLVCAIVYWILAKLIKRPWIIVIITYLLNIFLGKDAFISIPIDFHYYFEKFPLYYWFELDRFFTWGFWYSLGAASLPILTKFIKSIDSNNKKERIISNAIGYVSIALTIFIFLHNSNFNCINKVRFLKTNFIIVKAIIIIISVYYFSYFLKDSKYLNKIGKNTMIFIGIEFILHNYIALTVTVSLNLGVYNFVNSLSLITYTFLMFLIIIPLIDIINQYFPILNGKERKKIKEAS